MHIKDSLIIRISVYADGVQNKDRLKPPFSFQIKFLSKRAASDKNLPAVVLK